MACKEDASSIHGRFEDQLDALGKFRESCQRRFLKAVENVRPWLGAVGLSDRPQSMAYGV